MLPTIHSNGTSKDELIEQRTSVLAHLRDAETALQNACPNGRDYYHVHGSYPEAVKEHAGRLERLRSLITEIEQEAIAISEL